MRDVAILGAGELGGSIAHVLARKNVVRAVRLIDDAGRVAEGKALDIAQAAPVEGFATSLSGTGDIAACGGAAVVVLADRIGGGEWGGDDGFALLRRIGQFAPDAVVLCAGARQRDLVDRGVRELHIPPKRILGSAPESFSAAARALTALEANRSPRDVALVVLGNPPSQFALPWDSATIGGLAATRVLDVTARRRVVDRLPACWPPGPYALATAAVKVIDAMIGRSRSAACCFVGPDDSQGTRARTAALPVTLGPAGIDRVIVPELDAHDRVVLENAMLL